MEKYLNLQIFVIFISLFSFSIQKNNFLESNIISDHLNSILEQNSYQKFDEFIEDKLNIGKNNITYNFQINLKTNNELEQIFLDYQSEFGCLYITFNKNNLLENIEKEFCSKSKNNFFVIDIKDFFNKSEVGEEIIMSVKVKYNFSEFESDFDFEFSLKASLKKPINILEINSEHKTLCQMDKIGNEKYRCLFMIVNKSDTSNETIYNENEEKSLIIFPLINENSDEFNIYADYINKSIYNEFNKTILNSSIPNEKSKYINILNGKKTNFLRIPNENKNQYIYLSIESKRETLLELVSQEISENETTYSFPRDNKNKIQLFSINEMTTLKLNFYSSTIQDYIFSLNTIQGKSIFHIGSNSATKYTTDKRESNLLFEVDPEFCKSNQCDLIFEKVDDDHIFYLSFELKSKNVINELIYGKSSKFSFSSIRKQFLLYEYLPIKNQNINVNLQLYNFITLQKETDTFKVEVLFLSQEDIHEISKNESYINNFTYIAEGELNPITLATNLYLTQDLDEKKSYLFIKITPNFNYAEKIILGTTVSSVNSLIYPSERIYHYGAIHNITKITYRLEGNKKYHLMRLEFGCNSETVKWFVNRKYDEQNYDNDTDISFVVEYWKNGRELLTMYIEDGEDIYLTISTEYISTKLKQNFAFKYINSGKNGDFKNYRIKEDYLAYDIEFRTLKMNPVWNNTPSSLDVKYYLRVINESLYINPEFLNSISLIESKNMIVANPQIQSDSVEYDLKDKVDKYEKYESNCYVVIIENNNDIEIISYAGLTLEPLTVEEPSIGLIIASLSITGFAFITFFVRLIHHCCCIDDYYSSSYGRKNYDSYLI